MSKVLLLINTLALSPFWVTGQSFVVPKDACVWRSEQWGWLNSCEGNEVMLGLCGSGGHDDCGDGIADQVLCCDVPSYHFENCLDFSGDWGVHLSCPELTTSDEYLVAAFCGSGGDRDCKGDSHIARCCHGVFCDGSRLSSSGDCYWLHGRYGDQLTCTGDDQAVFGVCGAGDNPDCDGSYWAGIQCCTLVTV